ncbi:MAG TPA: hypothetical protein PKD55_10230 [Bellilinea sp.]|nr:hypothetical protein [Bellilinea sp.]
MSAIYVNNQWKEVEDIYVKDNGTWKLVSKAYVKRGQEWKEVPQIVRLAYASFPEDVPHPMPSPYSEGLGSFEVINREDNSWYISDGCLRTTGGGSQASGQDFRDSQARTTTTAGVIGVRSKVKATWAYLGALVAGQYSPYIAGATTSSGTVLDNGGATPRNLINIRHPNRTFIITELEPERYCLIHTSAVGTTFPQMSLFGRGNTVFEVEDFEVFKLKSGVFKDQYGLATTRLDGVRAQGENFTHEPNMLLYFRVSTLGPSGYAEVSFRCVDAENKTLVRIAADGSAEIIEVSEGVESVLGSLAAGKFTPNLFAWIRCDSGTIRLFPGLVGPESSAALTSIASVGLSATQGRIERLDPGWVVSDLTTWPYDVSQHLPFFGGTGGEVNPEPVYPEVFTSYKSTEIDSPLYVE